jgi:serine/threonine protein kinase
MTKSKYNSYNENLIYYIGYRLLKKLGEGTFSKVYKAQCISTGELVAIKCMKACYESYEEVNQLNEVRALKKLISHDNIITLNEVQ